MLKQPTFQSHQSVKVTDSNHARFGQVGAVVDVQERDLVKTVNVVTQVQKTRQADDGNGGTTTVQYWDEETVPETTTTTVIGVRFDTDREILDVPLSALQSL